MEHHRRHAGSDEGVVVGIVLDVPDKGEVEAGGMRRAAVGLHDRLAKAMGRPRAVDLEPSAPEPADHVEVDGKSDPPAGQTLRGHPEEVVGPEQSLLFAIPEGDQDRPPGPLG